MKLGKEAAWLVEDQGSLFELRAAVEPHVEADRPDAVLLYLGGRTRDLRGSPLLELEMAGHVADLGFARVARQVLGERYTDGIIDA